MNRPLVLLVAASLSLAACGREPKPTTEAPASGPAPAGEVVPDAGGKIITVEMTSDEKGNYFTPKVVEAHQGDVVRYTLKIGVHNVHFLPDSNPGVSGLPAASDLLQLPGQTYDYKVSLAPGTYYFQCDPHAALGMTGRLKVER